MTSSWKKYLSIIIVLFLFSGTALVANEVNLYSARKENLIKPLLDQFTNETGIKVNLVTGKASALLKRLQAEGRNTPADLFLTADAGRLHVAKLANLLQPVESKVLNDSIPAHLRDKDNQWFGLSKRARVIVYSKQRVEPEMLSTYVDLVNPKWKGKICIRSSGNIYNQSMLASIVAHHGTVAAQKWAAGVVANMARTPRGNDRAQIKAVAIGECDIAIVNSYYLGNMQASSDKSERDAAAKVTLFFPNQNDLGTHINVSGAGITKNAANRDNALKLLEFMISDKAQKWYASSNYEYPVKTGIEVSPIVQSWGYPFKEDKLDIGQLGIHNVTAVKIFDRVGWR